jgi:hypothetical protein
MPPKNESHLDFSKMMFDVSAVPQGQDLCNRFQKLGQIKEFQSYPHPDRNRVIRYVVMMYDVKSPLRDTYPDLQLRKEAALDLAGFDKNAKGDYKDEKVHLIMDMKDEEVNALIFEYLKLQNSRTWMMIVSTEEMFLEYQKLIMEPIKKKDGEKEKDILAAADIKKKLREECNAMDSDLERFYKKLSGDDLQVEEVIVKKKRSTPESIAKGGSL